MMFISCTFSSQWGTAPICPSPADAYHSPEDLLAHLGLLLLHVSQHRHHVCAEHGWLCLRALLCLGHEGPTSHAELSLAISSSLVLCPFSVPSHWETMTLH